MFVSLNAHVVGCVSVCAKYEVVVAGEGGLLEVRVRRESKWCRLWQWWWVMGGSEEEEEEEEVWGWGGGCCSREREAISQLVCSLGSQAENAADLRSKLKWCQCRNKAACRTSVCV